LEARLGFPCKLKADRAGAAWLLRARGTPRGEAAFGNKRPAKQGAGSCAKSLTLVASMAVVVPRARADKGQVRQASWVMGVC
jgi:hypothetical protein